MTVLRCSLRAIQCATFFALLTIVILAAAASPARAGTRRAVLVGIDTYNPCDHSHPNLSKLAPSRSHCSDWPDLKGSVNDAESMKSVIELRYGFKPENVHVLLNEQATRQAILGAIQKYLIEDAQPGDVVFFYYAGHGSQVRNSLSYERDKMDQTIVPADANRGVHDIRDKTLARLFNQMIDKRLVVTAIFDSCHSGAMARGFGVPTGSRYLPAIDNRDARDPFRGPFPENEGALIISAAQADERAGETESTPVHGRFTAALLRAMNSLPVNTSVSDVLKMVQAQVAANDPNQVLGYGINLQQIPNWAGKNRGEAPLFGVDSKQAAQGVTVAARRPSGEAVPLDGGLAVGLAKGTELKRIEQGKNAPEVMLEVVDSSAAQSVARVTQGKITDVHAGDLFEVVKWPAAPGRLLRLWIPANPPSSQEIQLTAAEQEKKSEAEGLAWISDPTSPNVCAPTEMYWGGDHWRMYRPDVGCTAERNSPSFKTVSLTRGPATHGQFFLSLPPTPALEKLLGFGNSAEITHSWTAANYLLVGRWHEGQLEYAWVHPGIVSEGAGGLPLPARSDWVSLKDQSPESVSAAASRLVLLGQRLSRVYGWLTLQSPPDSGDFPYHLALKQDGCGSNCGGYKTDGDTVKEGQQYNLVLLAKPADVAPSFSRTHKRRWVYVFVVDSWGCSQLLVPPSAAGNEEKTNLEPQESNVVTMETGISWPQKISLLRPDQEFGIGPPFGTDTYFLLTTRDPIEDLSVFQFAGARERGIPVGTPPNPIERLFQTMNSNTRGAVKPIHVPQDWTLRKIFIHSEGAPGEKPQESSGCGS